MNTNNFSAIEFEKLTTFQDFRFIWNYDLFNYSVKKIDIKKNFHYLIEFSLKEKTVFQWDVTSELFYLVNIEDRIYCFYIYEPKPQQAENEALGIFIYLNLQILKLKI